MLENIHSTPYKFAILSILFLTICGCVAKKREPLTSSISPPVSNNEWKPLGKAGNHTSFYVPSRIVTVTSKKNNQQNVYYNVIRKGVYKKRKRIKSGLVKTIIEQTSIDCDKMKIKPFYYELLNADGVILGKHDNYKSNWKGFKKNSLNDQLFQQVCNTNPTAKNVPQTKQTDNTPEQRLKSLKHLLSKGLITEKDYKTKKQEILEAM